MKTKQKNKKSQKNSLFLRFVEAIEKVSESIKDLAKTNKIIATIIGVLIIFILFFEVIQKWNDIKEIFPKSKKDVEFKSKDPKTLRILVLPFYKLSKGSTNVKIEEAIRLGFNELKEKEKLNIELVYDSITNPIDNSIKIFNYAKKKKADIVIYGYSDILSKKFKIGLKVIKKINYNILPFISDYSLPESIKSKFDKEISLPDIQSLSILNDQKFYTYFLLGYSAYKDDNCKLASKYFDNAFSELNKNESYKLNGKIISDYYFSLSFCLRNKSKSLSYKYAQKSLKYYDNFYSRLIIISHLIDKKLYNIAKYHIELLNDKLINSDNDEVYISKYVLSFYSFIMYLPSDIDLAIKSLNEMIEYEKQINVFPFGKTISNFIFGYYQDNIRYLKEHKNNNKFINGLKSYFLSYNYLFSGDLKNTIDELKRIDEETFTLINNNTNILKIKQKTSKREYSQNVLEEILNDDFFDFDDCIYPIISYNYNNFTKYIQYLEKIKKQGEFGNYINFNGLKKDSAKYIYNKIDSINLKSRKNYIDLATLSNLFYDLDNPISADLFESLAIRTNPLSVKYLDYTYKGEEYYLFIKKYDSITQVLTKTKSPNDYYSRGILLYNYSYSYPIHTPFLNEAKEDLWHSFYLIHNNNDFKFLILTMLEIIENKKSETNSNYISDYIKILKERLKLSKNEEKTGIYYNLYHAYKNLDDSIMSNQYDSLYHENSKRFNNKIVNKQDIFPVE